MAQVVSHIIVRNCRYAMSFLKYKLTIEFACTSSIQVGAIHRRPYQIISSKNSPWEVIDNSYDQSILYFIIKQVCIHNASFICTP